MNNSIVTKITHDLLQARKARDSLKTEVLQAVLTRITNAEAVASAGKLADMTMGVGPTEVARRQLTDADISAAIQLEIDDLQQALDAMASQPDHPYTAELRKKLAIAQSLIA